MLCLLLGPSMVVQNMVHLSIVQCTTYTTVLSSLANSLDFILQVAMRPWRLLRKISGSDFYICCCYK